jgi:hypothetical protein
MSAAPGPRDVTFNEDTATSLWVPKTVSPYVTWVYWWMRPPGRPRRRTRTAARYASTPEVYGRYIGGPAARIISPLPRYRIPVPALVEITDRVHRPCKFRPGSPLSRPPSSSAVVIIFPHWSRPPGFHVCSMFARMPRYHAVAPVSGRHSTSGDCRYLASVLA